jgi:hypothetical protein
MTDETAAPVEVASEPAPVVEVPPAVAPQSTAHIYGLLGKLEQAKNELVAEYDRVLAELKSHL